MRSFIVLSLLVATTCAASVGYSYGPGIGSTSQTFTNTATLQPLGSNVYSTGLVGGANFVAKPVKTIQSNLISTGNVGVASNIGSFTAQPLNTVQSSVTHGVLSNAGVVGTGFTTGNIAQPLNTVQSNTYTTGNNGVVNTIGTGYSAGVAANRVVDIDANALLNSVPQTVEYSKQFYHFAAPEEEQQEAITTKQLSNVLKKNLQVVFIRAPESSAAMNAALQLAKQAIEQRTAIYVLTKENDASQVVAQLGQIQENVQTTPEVRFIKYRTPEDIAHATEEIQSQYNSFGGSSEVFNGGVAPVLNYASQVQQTGGAVLTGSLLGTGNSVTSVKDVASGSVGVGGSTLVSNTPGEAYLPQAL